MSSIKSKVQKRAREVWAENPNLSGRQIADILAVEFPEATYRTVYDYCKPSQLNLGTDEDDRAAARALEEDQRAWWYNAPDDVYMVDSPYRVGRIIMPGDLHRSILESYSKYGENATINDLGERVGMEHAEMAWYLRAFGMTHGKLPFTDEEVDDSRVDPDVEEKLVSRVLALQRGKIHRKAQKRQWAETIRLAEVGRNLEDRREIISTAVAEALSAGNWNLPVAPPPTFDDAADVYCIYDRHIDKLNFDGAAERTDIWCNILEPLSLYPRSNEARLVFGGDFGNADNVHDTTTRGTPQKSMGRAGVQRIYSEAVRGILHLAGLYSKLKVVILPGNHDEWTMVNLWCAIEAMLEVVHSHGELRNVELLGGDDIANDLVVERFGSNLLAYEHGDGPKPNVLMQVLSSEKRFRRLWGLTDRTYAFTGHYHHAFEHMVAGGTVNQQPNSGTVKDRWHRKKGFSTSEGATRRYVIHKDEGMVAMYQTLLR